MAQYNPLAFTPWDSLDDSLAERDESVVRQSHAGAVGRETGPQVSIDPPEDASKIGARRELARLTAYIHQQEEEANTKPASTSELYLARLARLEGSPEGSIVSYDRDSEVLVVQLTPPTSPTRAPTDLEEEFQTEPAAGRSQRVISERDSRTESEKTAHGMLSVLDAHGLEVDPYDLATLSP